MVGFGAGFTGVEVGRWAIFSNGSSVSHCRSKCKSEPTQCILYESFVISNVSAKTGKLKKRKGGLYSGGF